MAVENHINFDAGNFVHVLDGPWPAMKKLVKRVFATQIKEIKSIARAVEKN